MYNCLIWNCEYPPDLESKFSALWQNFYGQTPSFSCVNGLIKNSSTHHRLTNRILLWCSAKSAQFSIIKRHQQKYKAKKAKSLKYKVLPLIWFARFNLTMNFSSYNNGLVNILRVNESFNLYKAFLQESLCFLLTFIIKFKIYIIF